MLSVTSFRLFKIMIIIYIIDLTIAILIIPTDIYLLKVSNRNTRTICEICSKITIKTPDRHQASC